MKAGSNLEKVLSAGHFAVTGELGPPRGADGAAVREKSQIAQFQSTAFNRPVASALPDFDVASLAKGMGIECLALPADAAIDTVLARVQAVLAEGRPVMVDAAVDYSMKTWFTRGVVKTMLGRLAWPDRIRFVARALVRRVTG